MHIIGHRGAKGLAPENTISSLQKALEHLRLDTDMIEFDVRVTKDNIPVLHHDPHITDPNGRQHVIHQLSYKELKTHAPQLTTLKAALDYIDARIILYIEVKPHEPVKPIVAVLRPFIDEKYGAATLRLASKSQKTLRTLHTALPNIPTIVIEPWSGVRATYRAKQVNTRALSMNQKWLWRGFIRPMAKRGWQLYAYTLNDPVKAKRWAGYGLAGVVTDYPDRLEK